MSPTERITIRNFWIAIISAIAFVIVSNVFGVPERISGVNTKIQHLENNKMNKDDATSFFHNLQILLAEQTTKWDQYMISNEKDKEKILHEIEIIQSDIKELIKTQKQVTRGISTD
jgi:hypothetical protein